MKREEMDELKGLHCERYYAAGSMNIENIEHVENLFPGNADLIKAIKSAQTKEAEDKENPLVLKLMPIFMDNEDYASEFLREIEGKKALDITTAVVKFRDAKKVSAQLCHHGLWQILHDEKIYPLTERNWNERIKY